MYICPPNICMYNLSTDSLARTREIMGEGVRQQRPGQLTTARGIRVADDHCPGTC